MRESQKQLQDYRPEIDGLRTLAILGVIFYHAELVLWGRDLLTGGFLGVDVFFVISGYLITAILLKELSRNQFSFAGFYERRIRRLLPALLTTLAAVFIVGLVLFVPSRLEELGRTTLSTLSFGSNFYFLNHAGYFAYKSIETPLLHTWSLAIEEQFYLVLPPLLVFFWRRARHLIQPLFITLFVLSLTGAHYGSRAMSDSAFFLLPFRFWELAAGSILAKLEFDRGRFAGTERAAKSLPWVGLTMILFAFFRLDRKMLHPSLVTLLPVAGTMLVIWFSGKGQWVTRVVGSRPMVAVGLVSYSLYLWHFPVFSFFNLMGHWQSNAGRMGQVALAATLALVTYHFVEKPFRNRAKVPTGTLLRSVGGATLILIGLGAAAVSTNGLSQRFRNSDDDLIAFDKDAHDEYLRRRFDQVRLKPFAGGKKVRLLVIGDSFGMDLVNALAEVGALRDVALATHLIKAECGNIYKRADIEPFLAAADRSSCDTAMSYQAHGLQPLLEQADVIWLASSWLEDVAKVLKKSVQDLESVSPAKVLILGRKSFGDVQPEQFIGMSDEAKRQATVPAARYQRGINEFMRADLNPAQFVDVQRLLCDDSMCRAFDANLGLISYDGSHLTRSGARILGEKLRQVPAVREALQLSDGV